MHERFGIAGIGVEALVQAARSSSPQDWRPPARVSAERCSNLLLASPRGRGRDGESGMSCTAQVPGVVAMYSPPSINVTPISVNPLLMLTFFYSPHMHTINVKRVNC